MSCKFTQGLYISIHAPSRERLAARTGFHWAVIFQSTLPRGSDVVFVVHIITQPPFQSTLPRGSDRADLTYQQGLNHFNPRSLAGATIICFNIIISLSNFNPRSLAGATVICSYFLSVCVFQSTLPRGSDLDVYAK